MSFLCVSSDVDKITVFAYATDAELSNTNGIKANEWVFRTLQAVGGRGGGKPAMAQGSAPDVDFSKVDIALKEAKKYVESVVVV